MQFYQTREVSPELSKDMARFPFSPRPGTPAARWKDTVPHAVIKDRCRQLREIGLRKKQAFFRRHIGKKVTLLVENRRDPKSGLLRGMTDNYIPVNFDGGERLINHFNTVTIDSVDNITVIGSRGGKL